MVYDEDAMAVDIDLLEDADGDKKAEVRRGRGRQLVAGEGGTVAALAAVVVAL